MKGALQRFARCGSSALNGFPRFLTTPARLAAALERLARNVSLVSILVLLCFVRRTINMWRCFNCHYPNCLRPAGSTASPSMSEIDAGARSDPLGVTGTDIDAAPSAPVIGAAGPFVLPDGPAAIALVMVDEGGLAAGLVLPLMGASRPFKQRSAPACALPRRRRRAVCRRRSGGRARPEDRAGRGWMRARRD